MRFTDSIKNDVPYQIEDYVKVKYNEHIQFINVTYGCIYNSTEEIYCISPESATVITDEYEVYRRYIDITIDHTFTEYIESMTSTSRVEEYGNIPVQLPFDMDYQDALEFAAKFGYL
jgi:hypothetical protein